MKITRDFVIQNLADSGLMSADDASSLCESLSSISGPADSDTVAQELAGSSELTAYQAQCVCKGETGGLMFGDYVVLEKIGQGGMGVVLKGQHRRMERTVAIKKLTSAALESEDLVKRFYREVKASARLLHPNVVTALDAREHEGVHYLIMEFIEGEDLADVLKRQGPLPVDEAVDYVVQAAQGLEFAHKHGVFHRDIKPANLLLDHEGTVKILDMGLARIVSEAKGNEASRDQLTSDDQVMGTCDYMAPEQAENTKGVDHRADIYSLGCTLYRLLTNQPPYTGANLMQLLLAHRESPIPSICDVRPDVPASVDAVFQKMMAKTRDERYQSMTEVIEALQAALGRGSAPAAAPAPDPGLMDFLKQIHDEPSGVSRGGRGSGKTDAAQAAVTVQEKADPTTNETVDISATADTDPSTATRQPSTPAARPHRPAARRKRKQTPLLLLIGVGIGISLIGVGVVAAVLYIQTDRGTVVVKTDHKDVQVLVRRGGDVHVADATNQWRIEVTSGKYSVELNEGNDRFVLDKDTITVTRGDEVRVRVELKPRPKLPDPAIAPFDTAQAKTHQKEWADYLGLPVERDFDLPGGEKLTMMLIPPGEFVMGSTAEEQARFLEDPKAADEGPQHRVRISRAFYLGKYEVTQAQWEAVTGNNPSYWKGPQKPVAHGKRGMIPPFLKKLNAASVEGNRFTLPTEAQWEYACRAGTATAYFCAEDESSIKEYGWFIVNSGGAGAPHPVGQKKANAWGLHDMYGNASEWCADWYAEDYYGHSPMNDPTGPEAGKEHVVRGGYTRSPVKDLRSARRLRHGYYAHAQLGLRLACTIPYARGTKRAVPAVSSSQPPAERPTAKGPDGESSPTGVDAAAPSTASLDDLPPWQLPPDAPKPAIAPFDAVQAKEHQQAWADYLGVPVETTNSIGMKLTLLPPGEFLMGVARSPNNATGLRKSESPRHPVRLTDAFYLGTNEVTVGEFRKFIEATNHRTNHEKAKKRVWHTPGFQQDDDNPVVYVSLQDARAFCSWLSAKEGRPYEIPTEARWEYACRAGSHSEWPFGDDQSELERYAWYEEAASNPTHPVGRKLPNGFGVFDMLGNAIEWTNDWYGADYYAKSPTVNPAGPANGNSSVLRGGSFKHRVDLVRPARRCFAFAINGAYHDVGFRVSLSASAAKDDVAVIPTDGPSLAIAPFDADEAKPDEEAGVGEDSAEAVRTWTDTSGKTVEATFVDIQDGMVRLRLPDGKIASVALDRLCKEDQAHIAKQTKHTVAP